MRTLYFDCFSGASGDMVLGALVDAGASIEDVRAQLSALGIEGWELTTSSVTRGAIRATHARVTTTEADVTRNLADVISILRNAGLPERVAARAERAFELLARAEARVHGVPVNDVHFHEVGALDAIVDITGVMAALEQLAPNRIVTSPIATGRGTVDSAHGPLPVPAPAVVEILKETKAVLVERGEGELLTPTGAAIVATVTDDFGGLPPMTVDAVGYGAGARDLELPNVVRVIVGEAVVPAPVGSHALIDTNIDDMTPELVPAAIDSLIAAGADDAWVTPIVMKKGRPAFLLSALVATDRVDRVLDVLYRETTTFGARISPVTKDALDRTWVEVEVAGHPVRVKRAVRAGEVVTSAPEYDDALKVARATGMALKEVYARATAAARQAIL